MNETKTMNYSYIEEIVEKNLEKLTRCVYANKRERFDKDIRIFIKNYILNQSDISNIHTFKDEYCKKLDLREFTISFAVLTMNLDKIKEALR